MSLIYEPASEPLHISVDSPAQNPEPQTPNPNPFRFCERELGEYEEMFDPVRQDAARL